MKKNILLKINEKEYKLGEYEIKDKNDLYGILFDKRDLLIKGKVEGISEYEENDKSYFINDILNFQNKNKENINGLSFDLNINKKITILID